MKKQSKENQEKKNQEYFEMRMRQEQEWWSSPKNRILNFLSIGAHGLRHVGLI